MKENYDTAEIGFVKNRNASKSNMLNSQLNMIEIHEKMNLSTISLSNTVQVYFVSNKIFLPCPCICVFNSNFRALLHLKHNGSNKTTDYLMSWTLITLCNINIKDLQHVICVQQTLNQR